MYLNRMSQRNLTNPDDLAANRSGTITERQRQQASRINWGAGCTVIFMIAVFGGALGIPFVTLAAEQDEWWSLLVPLVVFAAIGIPLGVFALIALVRLLLIRQDLAAGEVQQAEGTVAWRGHRYAADFPGRPFWANNTVNSLPPGPYRFYYLPRSGYILSGQPMPGMTVLGETSGVDQVMQRVIGFGPGDLEANRGGRLGGGQAVRMVVAIVGLGLVMLLVIGFGGFMAYGMSQDMDAASGLPVIFVGVFVIIIALVVGASVAKLALDLLSGDVAQIEGEVQRTYARSGRSTNYYYQVGGQKFSVTLRAYQAMVEGQNYRVYYAPRSKRLVALETIG